MTTATQIQNLYALTTGATINTTEAALIAQSLDQTRTSLTTYGRQLAEAHENTSLAAIESFQFFSGATPGSLGGLSYIQQTTQGLYDRGLARSNNNALTAANDSWVGFGSSLAADASFNSNFKTLIAGATNEQALVKIYSEVFGFAAGDAQVTYMTSGFNTFFSNYRAAGNTAEVATLRALGAMAGDLMFHAEELNIGRYHKAGLEFYGDAADGTVAFGASLFTYNGTDTVTINVPGPTVIVDRPVPGPTVYVDVPGQTLYVDRPVPGPTVYVDRPVPGPTVIVNQPVTSDPVSVTITGDAAHMEGTGSGTLFNYTVTRGGNISNSVAVNYAVAGEGANPTNGADFLGGVMPRGTLLFQSGETTKTLTFQINGDLTREPDETFAVTLSNATSNGTATITNNAVHSTVITDENFGAINAAGQTPQGTMMYGAGNTPTFFNLRSTDDGNVEIGLKAKLRGANGMDVTPTFDADNTAHYQFTAGPDPLQATRAKWSFDYSVLTGLRGSTKDLGDYKFTINVDTDPTANTNFQTFTLNELSNGVTPWTNALGEGFGDDETSVNRNVSENSVNFGFGFLKDKIDGDTATPGVQPYTFGPGHFDIYMDAFTPAGVPLVGIHIVVDIV